MSDTMKTTPCRFSRRLMLQGLVLTTAGGVAIAATSVIAAGKAKAQTKAPQKAVAYQDMPKGAFQCDNCLHFIAPASCKIVDGVIAPTGWCKVYVKKPA